MLLFSIGLILENKEFGQKYCDFTQFSDLVIFVPQSASSLRQLVLDSRFNSASNDGIFNASHRTKNRDPEIKEFGPIQQVSLVDIRF